MRTLTFEEVKSSDFISFHFPSYNEREMRENFPPLSMCESFNYSSAASRSIMNPPSRRARAGNLKLETDDKKNVPEREERNVLNDLSEIIMTIPYLCAAVWISTRSTLICVGAWRLRNSLINSITRKNRGTGEEEARDTSSASWSSIDLQDLFRGTFLGSIITGLGISALVFVLKWITKEWRLLIKGGREGREEERKVRGLMWLLKHFFNSWCFLFADQNDYGRTIVGAKKRRTMMMRLDLMNNVLEFLLFRVVMNWNRLITRFYSSPRTILPFPFASCVVIKARTKFDSGRMDFCSKMQK